MSEQGSNSEEQPADELQTAPDVLAEPDGVRLRITVRKKGEVFSADDLVDAIVIETRRGAQTSVVRRVLDDWVGTELVDDESHLAST